LILRTKLSLLFAQIVAFVVAALGMN